MNTGDDNPGNGPFERLFQMQSEFQQRLAEETVRYMRRLQGMVGPVAPGTVVMPESGNGVRANASAGGEAVLSLEVENRQRVHSMVTPMLSPLIGVHGVTWFAEAQSEPISFLIAPGKSRTVRVTVRVPADLPASEYRGALLLYGFRDGGVPVLLNVTSGKSAAAADATARKTARRGKKTTKPAAPRKTAASTAPGRASGTTKKKKKKKKTVRKTTRRTQA